MLTCQQRQADVRDGSGDGSGHTKSTSGGGGRAAAAAWWHLLGHGPDHRPSTPTPIPQQSGASRPSYRSANFVFLLGPKPVHGQPVGTGRRAQCASRLVAAKIEAKVDWRRRRRLHWASGRLCRHVISSAASHQVDTPGLQAPATQPPGYPA